MDDGDNFHKFICIILDCINKYNAIFSYSNSKFYYKELDTDDDLYSTFNNFEYKRTKDMFNAVIDNLLKYQKYFNIQSLPKYKIKDTENKIDLQITIPNIFNCIQESFDIENWYYDRIRNRKEEMNKRYVNYPSIGIINNKELMNRTFFGGDPAIDLTISNDIILNTGYYLSYDLLLVHVLINFCYILNDGYYLSPNILTMFLLSKIHYLIGKYYVINCNYYKTIKQLDNKILNLFAVNDSRSNHLTYYQNDISQLFNFRFAYTKNDNYISRMLILNNVLFYLPNIINTIKNLQHDNLSLPIALSKYMNIISDIYENTLKNNKLNKEKIAYIQILSTIITNIEDVINALNDTKNLKKLKDKILTELIKIDKYDINTIGFDKTTINIFNQITQIITTISFIISQLTNNEIYIDEVVNNVKAIVETINKLWNKIVDEKVINKAVINEAVDKIKKVNNSINEATQKLNEAIKINENNQQYQDQLKETLNAAKTTINVIYETIKVIFLIVSNIVKSTISINIQSLIKTEIKNAKENLHSLLDNKIPKYDYLYIPIKNNLIDYVQTQKTQVKSLIDDININNKTDEVAKNDIKTKISEITNHVKDNMYIDIIKLYDHRILLFDDTIKDDDIDGMKKIFNNNKQMIEAFKNFLIDNKYVISVGGIDTLFNKLQNDPFTNPITLNEYKILQKGNIMFMSAVFKTIEKNLKTKYYYPIKFKSNIPRYTPYPVIPNKIANIKELLEKYDINNLINQDIINQFFRVNTLKQIPKFKPLIKSGGSSDINIHHQMLLNIAKKLKLKNTSINKHDITVFNNKMNKIESIKNELQELVNQLLIINDKDKINEYNNKLTEYNKENHNIIEFLNQLDQYV